MNKTISKIEDLDDIKMDFYLVEVFRHGFQAIIFNDDKTVEIFNIKQNDISYPYPTYTLQEIITQLKTRYNFNIEYQAEQIKLNDEDIKICKALKTLGYNWIARDMDNELIAYDIKPVKNHDYYEYDWNDLLLTNNISSITFDNSPYEIPNFE